MASTTEGHDSKDSTHDKAPGASHDSTVKRPNRDKPLLQKISENSELKMSWIEQIEELEREGTVINKDNNMIISGPPLPSEAAEGGRKDPRIIIPNDPSKFPGFPTDMNLFDTPAEFGLAVITFWAKWRKAKKISSAKAKKEAKQASLEAEKQRISNQNDNVVGGARGRGRERDESENRLSLDRRQSRHSRYDRFDRPRSENRRKSRSRDRREGGYDQSRRENQSRDRRVGSSAATGSNAIQAASQHRHIAQGTQINRRLDPHIMVTHQIDPADRQPGRQHTAMPRGQNQFANLGLGFFGQKGKFDKHPVLATCEARPG